ncbi:MAG: hypothetical protein ACYTFM_12625 [Planctomycetota bacterium]|jgi:hypothetical protein
MGEDHKYETVTLEEYEPQLWSCQNCFCGLCLESCPAYRELKNEAVSARGLAQMAIAPCRRCRTTFYMHVSGVDGAKRSAP